MNKLTLMIGESGSGKSTRARDICNADDHKTVRVNRDDIRAMLFDGNWNHKREKLVKKVEQAIALSALTNGYNVVVDDTNIHDSNIRMWAQFAIDNKVEEVNDEHMNTAFETCWTRDAYRTGKAHVGRAVIERQFLVSGRATFGAAPIVLVDIDGTLADHEGVRSPYDEGKVLKDKPYPVVVEWVRNLPVVNNCRVCEHLDSVHYGARGCALCECTNPLSPYSVTIISGRHDTCCDDTITWLAQQGIRYDHIFMRGGGDNRPDTIVKKEILDGILKLVPKEQIAFVIDDRPSVIQMWKDNGLCVFPARGAVEPF